LELKTIRRIAVGWAVHPLLAPCLKGYPEITYSEHIVDIRRMQLAMNPYQYDVQGPCRVPNSWMHS
jgi:hypothetical protein